MFTDNLDLSEINHAADAWTPGAWDRPYGFMGMFFALGIFVFVTLTLFNGSYISWNVYQPCTVL